MGFARLDLTATPYRGSSMEPTLRSGDTILWRRQDGSIPLRVGDVVGYHSGQRLVAHRVQLVDLAHASATTRGDANLFADPPVSQDAIEYVAVAAWRGGQLVDLGSRRGLRGLTYPIYRELRRFAAAQRRRLTR